MADHNDPLSHTSLNENIDKDEIRANTAISDLIAHITILTARKDPLIRSIKSPKLLIRGLTELQGMVEMVDIKLSIVNQIKFLITNQARKQQFLPNTNVAARSQVLAQPNSRESQFEGHMLHSVISGNPGTGKTTVGMILAKIWMALGFVNKKDDNTGSNQSNSTQSSTVPVLTNVQNIANTIVNTVNESYRKRIRELEENQRNSHRKFDRIREMLNQHHTTSGEIRRKAIRLRPLIVGTTQACNPTKLDSNYEMGASSHPQQNSKNSSRDSKESQNKLVSYESRDANIDIEKEWEIFLGLTRSLRFGFDELIREANSKDPAAPAGDTGGTGITGTDISVSPPQIEPIREEPDPYENVDPKFIIAAREDLVAEYLGQTAPKTKKVLESAKGGVLFIDEAYSLCNMDGGSKDKYGEECLTTINEFMSLHPEEIIIIFAGYKDKLMNSIFKAQPGLLRRCAYFFEIKDYTVHGLAKIFKRQLLKNEWLLDANSNPVKIFKQYKDLIHEGGGFTEKLAFFSKLIYGTKKFDATVNRKEDEVVIHDSIITDEMLYEAINMLKNSSMMDIDNAPPDGMYL
ncbi:Hypothetical protein HVR_LOCUS31 [uncultured virus]|nr:Hypothetical protein HVR_LOCUS31 [uncultured virus]